MSTLAYLLNANETTSCREPEEVKLGIYLRLRTKVSSHGVQGLHVRKEIRRELYKIGL